MKKLKPVVRLLNALLLSGLLLGLSSCGQSGPLYMPDDMPKSQRVKK